jgi:hypothetical protein
MGTPSSNENFPLNLISGRLQQLHQRPPWRGLWRLEGHDVDDSQVVAYLVDAYSPDGPDHPIHDGTWFDAVDITLGSCARASRLLRELNIGPKIK